MSARVIVSGVRLLIAAVLCSLLTVPAAAHSQHGNAASVFLAVAASDTLANQATSADGGRRELAIAAPATFDACSCCWGPSNCSTGCGCAYGTACGSGACCHASGALAYSSNVSVTPSLGVAENSRSDQFLAGEDLCPGDRPPAV